MNTKEAIQIASTHLEGLKGHSFDLLTISKPTSIEATVNLTKVVSKLSPILGNLIEFNTVDFLNRLKDFKNLGCWLRQDPGFPDACFQGNISPAPGFEIKSWFPLATEITARFKESQNNFLQDETYVVILAWLPSHLIFGKPKIIDVGIFSGRTIALARDLHYHNPPDYLVLEPEDTTSRTRNLRQTNTNGYKWQETDMAIKEKADSIVNMWGKKGRQYKPTREYQAQLRELITRFSYRLDTNFAKMDRIEYTGIEDFKSRVLTSLFHGKTIGEWKILFNQGSPELLAEAFSSIGIDNSMG